MLMATIIHIYIEFKTTGKRTGENHKAVPIRIQKKISKKDTFYYLFWIAILSEIQGSFSDKSQEKSYVQEKRKKYFFG